MKANLKIAICQMQVSDNKATNLKHAEEIVLEASQKGAQMVILPEIFNAPYQNNTMVEYAESFPGKSTAFMSNLACNNKIVLVGGSIPEMDKAGKIFNCSYIFDRQGALIGKHRKIHLFDIDIPGQISFKESEVFSAGDSLEIIQHPDFCFAVIICYDVRFPELARMAALKGAKLLVIPAAFSMATGQSHWELLMRTRAVDNQMFVVAASPARNSSSGYKAWGHSIAVDPWGNIIAAGGIGEEIIYAELDWSLVDKVRQELPILQHRRPDLY